jgi:hypothetical protein
MENRITPEKITVLRQNEIFVFGSNESGIHGAGAAKIAYEKFGATYGVGFGLQGLSFAIPTKDWKIQEMKRGEIRPYVNRFKEFAFFNRNLIFLVTEIGCGLAGHSPKDIAPMFIGCEHFKNIHLPQRFWDVLNKEK